MVACYEINLLWRDLLLTEVLYDKGVPGWILSMMRSLFSYDGVCLLWRETSVCILVAVEQQDNDFI
jgi:hypothetical protein